MRTPNVGDMAPIDGDAERTMGLRLPFELLSSDGAALRLLPVLELAATESAPTFLTDVEILASTLLIRFLGRQVSKRFLEELRRALLTAAGATGPVRRIPPVRDDRSGLVVSICAHTEVSVIVQVMLSVVIDGDPPAAEEVALEVSRADLMEAAHLLG